VSLRIGVLEGDGIGPEVVSGAVTGLTHAAVAEGAGIEFMPLLIGASAIAEFGTTVPQVTLESLADCDGWILGPHDSASYPEEFRSQTTPSGRLRKHFDLYANLRPSYTVPGIDSGSKEVDLLVVRENTEGFYADRSMFRGTGEQMPTPDVALATGVFTRPAIRRIAHAACRQAVRRKGRLDIIHKANVLRMTSGMFLEECRTVAREYPGLDVRDHHVDAAVALLVRLTDEFDVIVAENMFGDILSELTAELVGGLGLAPSLNAGDDRAMAQATHGSAPDIAGKDIANPAAEMLSTSMLLDWLSIRRDAPELAAVGARLTAAVKETIASGVRTRDLGGSAGTGEFVEAVCGVIDGGSITTGGGVR
jgi:3-isopropylmalate dehydrogenase